MPFYVDLCISGLWSNVTVGHPTAKVIWGARLPTAKVIWGVRERQTRRHLAGAAKGRDPLCQPVHQVNRHLFEGAILSFFDLSF